MRNLVLILALLGSGAALAQVPPAELGQRYVPAPWWMKEPVIASMGHVRTELPANRAFFGAAFSEVDRQSADAQRKAAARVQALDSALRAVGADRVRLTTTFATRPIYEQYKDKDGNLQDNRRADKIDRYEVSANVSLEVRDIAVLERAYGLVLGARPTSVSQVGFRLEPGNETKSELAAAAVKDAARRAHEAAAAAGARLGAVKVIDPRGGVCETEVLAGWPSYVGSTQPTDVEVSGSRMSLAAPAPPPPPPPPPPGEAIQELRVTLQPPVQELTAQACVIYGIGQ